VEMHHVNCISPKRLQKMTECIFRGASTRVTIYKYDQQDKIDPGGREEAKEEDIRPDGRG
jgi:hypothetical protein